MRKIIMLFTAVALFSSCGIFKDVSKHTLKESATEQSSRQVKTEISTRTIDKSVITLTESLDTTIKTPEVKGKSEKKVNLNDVKSGLTVLDDQFVTLNQIYNPVDSTLRTEYTLKPQKVVVPKKKITQVNKDVSVTQAGKTERKQEEKKENKKADAIVDRKANYSVFIFLIAFIALLILAGWMWKNKV